MAISQIVTNSIASGQTLTTPTLSSPTFVTPASSVITSGTAVASTSGTSINFTGIPSWVKRITVLFNSVSTNGTSNFQVQIGAGSITSSGYVGSAAYVSGGVQTSFTSGFGAVTAVNAGNAYSGTMTISTLGSNIWVSNSSISVSGNNWVGGGVVTLGGTLDRVRVTTSNGTDTFDAGSINILYE